MAADMIKLFEDRMSMDVRISIGVEEVDFPSFGHDSSAHRLEAAVETEFPRGSFSFAVALDLVLLRSGSAVATLTYGPPEDIEGERLASILERRLELLASALQD